MALAGLYHVQIAEKCLKNTYATFSEEFSRRHMPLTPCLMPQQGRGLCRSSQDPKWATLLTLVATILRVYLTYNFER